MSEQQQVNERIAEILGWQKCDKKAPHDTGWKKPSVTEGYLLKAALPNWYSDLNAFQRDCVPMLREKGILQITFNDEREDGGVICRINLKDFETYYSIDPQSVGIGPDMASSAALAFIEVFHE